MQNKHNRWIQVVSQEINLLLPCSPQTWFCLTYSPLKHQQVQFIDLFTSGLRYSKPMVIGAQHPKEACFFLFPGIVGHPPFELHAKWGTVSRELLSGHTTALLCSCMLSHNGKGLTIGETPSCMGATIVIYISLKALPTIGT